MEKKTKRLLMITLFLVFIGLIIFTLVMSKLNWDFAKLSTSKFETNTYAIPNDFNKVSVNTDSADIHFALSDDGKCVVQCDEEEKAKHSVTIKDDTLVIEVMNEKLWYDYIGIHFRSPKITVSLPKQAYASLFIRESTGDIVIPKSFTFENVDISLRTGDIGFFASASAFIKMKTSTGDICIESMSAGALDLTVSTGKITVYDVTCDGDINMTVSTGKTNLSDVSCKNLKSNGSTGNISLYQVTAAEKFSIQRSTGDVIFDSSDAAEIFIETDTGDVKGSLLTDKIYLVTTDTGNVNVPKTAKGGICEITTGTGDIKITVDNTID